MQSNRSWWWLFTNFLITYYFPVSFDNHTSRECNPHAKHLLSCRISWLRIKFSLPADHCMYLSLCSANIFADDLASKNSSLISVKSSSVISSFPFILDNRDEGVSNCTAYLKYSTRWNKRQNTTKPKKMHHRYMFENDIQCTIYMYYIFII